MGCIFICFYAGGAKESELFQFPMESNAILSHFYYANKYTHITYVLFIYNYISVMLASISFLYCYSSILTCMSVHKYTMFNFCSHI